MPAKKLIEVALPLEEINKASAREKSIRHGHPSTLHLWWSRKPLATTRAVIWASLVDDPSSHPEIFPTIEEQDAERERLFEILKKLVIWEKSNNKEILDEAKAEIKKSTGNNLPELLDPFAGGGSIPLEGQRLGLKVHAHDLNPVAVMINKAMIEIPPSFSGQPPVNPESRSRIGGDTTLEGVSGLAEDVRYYGERLKEEAFKKIGNLYPKVKTPEGDATVIAWIWARTVKCPNPACGCEMPLTTSFILSKKKGHEAWVEPIFNDGHYNFKVHTGKIPKEAEKGTKASSRATFICPHCGTTINTQHLKDEAIAGRMGKCLMAIVAEGRNERIYLSPTQEHENIANVDKPKNYPNGTMPNNPRWFSPPLFGMTEYGDLFTNRQLTMLTTLSDLINDIQKEIECDVKSAGIDKPFEYAQAVSVYLAFARDKTSIFHVSLCPWNVVGEKIENCFGRQALPMIWNFAEGNPFSYSSGCFRHMLDWVMENIANFPAGIKAEVSQADAQSDCGLRDLMISTDPPYYDNIGYADLSDYFYIWLKQSLKNIYPEIFKTMLVPKSEELIASPYRHNGDWNHAKSFFENGMFEVCKNLYQYARADIPVTIYYAYKQSETEENEIGFETISSGWETMLNAIIKAGFSITGTWPLRTERPTALKNKVNALASSIVLVCRKRPANATATTRRDFVKELRREIRPALEKLQQSNIAPVDMPQSAIGPGMAVFSKYPEVLEADGKSMTVRNALQIINQELDSYFNEQEGETDDETRFCVELYKQKGFDTIKFGDADNMARAKGISVEALSKKGIVYAKGGNVHLIDRDKIEIKINYSYNTDWLLTQMLTKAFAIGGREACAKILAPAMNFAERAKNLAYRLYNIAERKKWTQETYAYNSLVTEWTEIIDEARKLQNVSAEQLSLSFEISNKE